LPIFVTVASGQSRSAAFALDRPERPLVIHVPSLSAASEVRLTFSPTSGSGFAQVFRPDGTGAFFTVASGAGPFFGYLPDPPTPWGQVWLAGSQSDVGTFALYSLRR
jgi:hypothetical protein